MTEVIAQIFNVRRNGTTAADAVESRLEQAMSVYEAIQTLESQLHRGIDLSAADEAFITAAEAIEADLAAWRHAVEPLFRQVCVQDQQSTPQTGAFLRAVRYADHRAQAPTRDVARGARQFRDGRGIRLETVVDELLA